MAARDASFLLLGLFVILNTWGVWAQVEVNMEDRVEVFRGDTAQIVCMFTSSEGIGGIMIQWSYVLSTGEKQRIYYQDSTMKVQEQGTQFTDRISVNGTGATGEVVLTIEDVQLRDELEFNCLISNLTDGAAEGRTKLKVFKTPALPTIDKGQTGISVNEEGLSKIGTCEVKNGFPRPNITWYRNNEPLRGIPDKVDIVPAVTSESSGLFSVTSDLHLKVVKSDKDDEFYCEVTYFVPGGTRMTETDKIKVIVYYPATAINVWVESPKGKIKEGDSVEFHCQDDGNSPSSVISFKHKEREIEGDSNVFVLENVNHLDSGLYVCESFDTDTYDSITGNTSIFVNYLKPAEVKPKSHIVLAQGNSLEVTCDAESSLQTQTSWLKDEMEVEKGTTLMVKDASFDTAGTYRCVVTVPEIEGMETSSLLHINVEGRPEFLSNDDTEIEENYDETVELSCEVRGFPIPKVMWTMSDGKVLETASEEITEDVVKSTVNIKVTSDITAFCNASNDHGSDALTFRIKAPVITTPAPTTTTTTTTAAATTTTNTTAATTTTNTTAATTTTSNISSTTVKDQTEISPKKVKKETSGVIIAVIIICILLLAILGSVLYFLYKKGKLCGRSGKQDLTKEKSSKDNIVVEMKSDNTEEAVLLGVNGEKQPSNNQ